jgi:glycolate oxidase iron-sulfur subunit
MTPDEWERSDQELMTCVHCGLCLNACPTYLETGSEADSPRGRIVLMRALREGRLSARDEGVVRHLDLCLGCRACETACPSGVPYGHLLEHARERIAAEGGRPPLTEIARQGLLAMLSGPGRMEAALALADRVGVRGGVPGPVARALAGGRSGTTVPLPVLSDVPLPPAVTPAVGKRRARVGVLLGCVMRVMYGDVNADTVRVLAADGVETLANRRQGCCGSLHLHNGYGDAAKAKARALIDAYEPWDGLDAIVVNSAGCGSAMKDYGSLLAGDPRYAERAKAFAAKVRDISEFLDDLGWTAEMRALGGDGAVVAYHDACHLAHGQQIREAPRRLLARIPGVTPVPLPESEICCGSAGIYNLTEPDMAARLQRRKVERIRETGASIVATGNPGCLAWIQAGLTADEPPIRVVHPVTLLAEALRDAGA